MAHGLRTPLSPREESTLRRVAHAAPTVDPESIRRLLALALVEPIRGGWRLTATGKLRYDVLPKAVLIKGGPSTRLTSMFIDALLEKATTRARAQGFAATPDTARYRKVASKTAAAETIAVRANPVAKARRQDAPYEAAFAMFEPAEWRVRARQRIECVRATLDEQRRRHAHQLAASSRCIEQSRSVLGMSVPRWPAWWLGAPDGDGRSIHRPVDNRKDMPIQPA